jgi:hypothetical protein
MTAIDYVFLGAGVLALGLMLIGSNVLRAILWETLRHPLRASRIEVNEGQLTITHPEPIPADDAQPKSPAGAH